MAKVSRLPLSVKQAAAGTARDLLVALRNQIAEQIDEGVPARDLAALSRRLMEIRREIEEIDAQQVEDGVGKAAATPDERWDAG